MQLHDMTISCTPSFGIYIIELTAEIRDFYANMM